MVDIEIRFTGGGMFDGGSEMQTFANEDNIWTAIDVYDEISNVPLGRYILINIERTGNGNIAIYKYEYKKG
jgi:hypothetical protein